MRRDVYLSWVAFCEGQSDQAYYDVLLPRVMEEITLAEPVRAVTVPQTPARRVTSGRNIGKVADEVCKNSDSFRLLFIHADTGGRALEAAIDERGTAYCRAVRERCDWPAERCVVLSPRHETEAWVLADPAAITAALGVRGDPARYGLPMNAAAAETLPNPKDVLRGVVRSVVGRRNQHRGGTTLFTLVAQMQNLDALRGSRSFRAFEADLRRALISLGCLKRLP